GTPAGGAAWKRPLGAAVATTAVVTALSYFTPPAHAASAVGLGFLGATYVLTLRGGDPNAARHFGLSLGGLLDLEPLDLGKLLKSAATELALALAIGAVVFPLFWVGFVAWWSPTQSFHPDSVRSIADEALGQLLVIALPEEAFYRGFLQTSLDDAWPPRFRFLGTWLGPGVVVTSIVFALGHVATEVHPNRLGVFFPSLLFGYLRSRRGGIGSAAAFHALCNLFASFLARSYGLGG
ncbi:MAG TPA: MrtC family glutamic-type intramembrane protease, partial [Polyangiaceae bacterium]